MARFVFRLQAVLRQREIAEQLAARRVAEVEAERRRLEQRVRRGQHHIAEGRRMLRGRLTGRLDLDEIRRHGTAAVQSMRGTQRAVVELAGVHRRLEAARGELVEARRRRRVVEILRDRQLERWRKRIAKAEAEALDELAARRARERSP
ncbi:MAG: flagellar FliJ family protein [Planctomycetota bacterium]|jgi:flagellar FliJ protein